MGFPDLFPTPASKSGGDGIIGLHLRTEMKSLSIGHMDYSYLPECNGLLSLDSGRAHFSMDAHIHNEFVISVYLSGEKAYACRNEPRIIAPGNMLVIPPGVAHWAKSNGPSGCHYRAIYPNFQQLAEITGFERSILERAFFVETEISPEVGGIALGIMLIAALEEFETELRKLALSEFLIELFSASPRGAMSTNPKNLQRVKEFLTECPNQLPSLSDLAALAELSPAHLCRAYKEHYGLSPFQQLRAERASRARNMIRSGVPLAVVAADTGFSDQSHMGRWFKRIFGVGPNSFAPHQ